MSLRQLLSHIFGMEAALAFAFAVSFVATLVVVPRAIRKLRGAKITGRDRNKPELPEIPEMGGLAVFIGFATGVFAFLAVQEVPSSESVLLVGMITAAGATITGVIDDLVALRQRFKAILPVLFAAPLSLFLDDFVVTFPLVGAIDFGIAYPLLLVPLGIACASNGFNILEGFNGLGVGVGAIATGGLAVLAILNGHPEALVLLLPLGGSLLAFGWYNKYPARIFPGDTMTLFVGATLATAAMIAKVEFWGALLFLPHIIEFLLKAKGSFRAQNFPTRIVPRGGKPPLLHYAGRTESLTHVVMKRSRVTEPGVAAVFWGLEAVLVTVAIAGFLATRA